MSRLTPEEQREHEEAAAAGVAAAEAAFGKHEDALKDELRRACPECGEPFNATFKVGAALDRAVKRAAASGNYVADTEVNPTEVLFANGRVVRVVKGALVVGWDKERADKVFAEIVKGRSE